MGLTTAMYTALTGINANQQRIDTIGNNISNVNTTAFKNSRTLFQTQFSRTLSLGNGPSESSGGTNPTQYGLGVSVGATQRDMNPGSVETTGIASDLAFEGDGFFVIRRPNGQQVYTRDGAFGVSLDNRLVTKNGEYVQGFGVDSGFNIVPGVLSDLTIPLGTLTIARPTQNVVMDGDLSAAGTLATESSDTRSQALVNGGGAPADAGTLLTDLRTATVPAVPLFTDGAQITVSGVNRGDREMPAGVFTVGQTGSTLGDFADWLQATFGIHTDAGLPGTPGVTIENGQLIVRGNAGLQNSIVIAASDITSTNPAAPLSFTFTQSSLGNGAGAFTSYTVYDSLGNPVQVNVTFALESTPLTGPVWRFYVEQADGGANRVLGTGTIQFDTQGNFVSSTGSQLMIDRAGTGADPIAFNLDFSRVNGLSTQISNVIMSEQDGFPPGVLTAYGVGEDGVITGAFSNGLTRTLGQVAAATFANSQGLVADAGNTYLQGANSGTPSIAAPGQFAAGTLLSGALELSNVDLSREFIGLITSSAGFQASSRVITVSRDLLDQLLLVVR